MSMIEVKNLDFKFGKESVLKHISISVDKGRFYSIIGPNGSGKTTLLRNISRVLQPVKNTIFINNGDISFLKQKDIAKTMAVVPQNTNIDFDFTVLDIVMMGRAPHLRRFETENKEDLKKVREAMEITKTWALREKNINHLSGGERQRVIVARAIAQDTDVILLDEPVSNLDLYHQIEVMNTVKALVESRNIIVIAVLHDLNLASSYSDYIFLMNNGKIFREGTPEDVITEENINDVYKVKVSLTQNPFTQKPHIIICN
jgi:iron complex transport system ATP-binding protein